MKNPKNRIATRKTKSNATHRPSRVAAAQTDFGFGSQFPLHGLVTDGGPEFSSPRHVLLYSSASFRARYPIRRKGPVGPYVRQFISAFNKWRSDHE